ncbi:MAG: hypothetical protein IT304_11135 [Dehalococcoidia bacterium]|nr:hypothetical protein [Dehalococcoidia bacterium]
MDDPVALAVALAERQLAALEQNDFDAFLAGEEEYAAACAVAARVPGAGSEANARLQRLVLLTASISGQLDQLAAGTSRQLERLGRSRAATLAYLGSGRPAPLSTREG